MAERLLVTLLLLQVAACERGSDGSVKTYTSDEYRLRIDVPASFEVDSDYYPVRLSDRNGFVQISHAGTATGRLGDACEQEARHHLQPYGPKPRIDFVTLDRQLACRISPSGAVNPNTSIGVSYIVSTPEAVRPGAWAGRTPYRPSSFVLVSADEAHVQLIPRTLKFLRRSPGPGLEWRESPFYRIRFAVPEGWEQTSADVGFGFKGPGGTVKVDSLGGPRSIAEACRSLSHHRRRPYGRNPRVGNLTVDGQVACRITPDGTEGATDPVPHALVVEYPEPLTPPGPDGRNWGSYGFLTVDADGEHVELFARSLQFVRDESTPAVRPAPATPPAPPRPAQG